VSGPTPGRPGLLDRLPDTTPALLVEGYRWGARLCRAQRLSAARTRILGQRAVVVLGRENAQRFYSGGLVRAGAAPRRLQRTLFGVGGVQGLDGAEHLRRKAMFLELLGPESADQLAAVVIRRWRDRLPDWEGRRVELLDEVGQLLCAAVCEWAGVPVPEVQVPQRHRQLESLIEGGAAVGPRYTRAVVNRKRLERWAAGLVRQVRADVLHPPGDSALAVVARHRGCDQQLLEPRVAAVELLNILRPTVAVDRYVVWAAMALHEDPDRLSRLDTDDAVRRFVLEVRRTAPFFPLVAARACDAVEFVGGVTASPGTRVLLDLHGTNHDPQGWRDPERFDPDRFEEHEPDPYELVPQGGGDHAQGHRCAGEWVTTAIVSAAVRLLTQEISYRVPAQDLSVDLRRMPARPASGFVIDDVRRLPVTAGVDRRRSSAGGDRRRAQAASAVHAVTSP
jgi:fatty-acid peroxygenase